MAEKRYSQNKYIQKYYGSKTLYFILRFLTLYNYKNILKAIVITLRLTQNTSAKHEHQKGLSLNPTGTPSSAARRPRPRAKNPTGSLSLPTLGRRGTRAPDARRRRRRTTTTGWAWARTRRSCFGPEEARRGGSSGREAKERTLAEKTSSIPCWVSSLDSFLSFYFYVYYLGLWGR